MNTREAIIWDELLTKEKNIRRQWQRQETNWKGVFKPFSPEARQLQDLSELVGELVDPSEVFMLVKKPDECRRELKAELLKTMACIDKELSNITNAAASGKTTSYAQPGDLGRP